MKLIMVGGIPTAGKTTFARQLATHTGAQLAPSTDFAYYDIADAIGFKERMEYANPKHWKQTDAKLLEEHKWHAYSKNLMTLRGEKSVIIEGYGVCFEQDRRIITDILIPDEILFFFIRVPYGIWGQRRTKEKNESSWREYHQLVDWCTLPSEFRETPTQVYYVDHP